MLYAIDNFSFRAGGPEPLSALSTLERALSSDSIELSELWRWLLAGEVTLTATFAIGNRSFAVLGRSSAPCVRPPPHSAEILERVFEGECPKALADELGMAVSSLSTRCAVVLRAIGARRWPSRASALLVMAGHAARGVGLGRARVDGFCSDGTGRWVVSAPNPVAALRPFLTDSECDVARLAIDGKTHAEIGDIRNTSHRTVANQLASIFKKLRVSGRASLRAKAVVEFARSDRGA